MVGLYFVLWGKSQEKKAGNQEKEKDLTRQLLEEENSHKYVAPAADIP